MRPTSILFHRELEEKLELLQDLEFDDDSRWMQDCSVPEPGVTLAYADEDAFDDCDACVYDPGLFPPSSPHRSYIVRPDLACTRDKPLPAPPSSPTSLCWSPPPLPSTPRLTCSPTSSSASSARSSISYYYSASPTSSPSHPRSRPPSLTSRATMTHQTFPSISSTLSNLDERENELEKPSGVLVTGRVERMSASAATVLPHPPVRKSSRDALKVAALASAANVDPPAVANSTKKPRPVLPALSTSASSPQLRTLAWMASVPASPVAPSSPAHSTFEDDGGEEEEVDSKAYVFPAIASDRETSADPVSRWSIDSHGPLPARPSISSWGSGSGSGSQTPIPATPTSPSKRRNRFLSLISRKSGSKSSPEADHKGTGTNTNRERKRGSRVTSQPSFSTASLASPSPAAAAAAFEQGGYPPLPMVLSTSTSTSTSTSPSVATSSSISLTTPADSSANLSSSPSSDPFSASISGPGNSYIPDPRMSANVNVGLSMSYDGDEYDSASAPLEPTLPSPSPGTPTASFLIPVRPSTSIPIFSAISLRRKQQRKKKLIIRHPIFAEPNFDSGSNPRAGAASGAADRDADVGVDAHVDGGEGEAYRREVERKRVLEELYEWCASFGPVKTMKRKGDSLHVYWKSWEAADLVCRVQGHVNIANVGTVCVTWQYV